MKLIKNTVIFFTVLILITFISCSKEKLDAEFILIKSEVSGNKTVSKYIYNSTGKISENQSLYYYTRYNYDSNNRLLKSESAVEGLHSGTASTRTELMTSQNSGITRQQVFEYNQSGRLEKVKNYSKSNDLYMYTSMSTFNYDGKYIIKTNLHNADDVITQFHIYEYDNKGNVITEKYYTNFESTSPKLIRETSFRYDNKINPFKIFEALGIPGLYTNQNNITEVHTVFQEPTPGLATNPVAKTSYLYNAKGFPVKVFTENSEFAYRYE